GSRAVKTSSGYNLKDLVVGSEGTLGVVTRIRVRLAPRAPEVRTALALFDDVGTAGAAVSRIIGEGLLPVALELVDHNTIRIVEASEFAAGLPEDAGAALIVESEGLGAEVEAEMGAVRRVLEEAGARRVEVAREAERRQRLWQARKKAYGALGRLAPDILVQDAAVPRSALPELLPEIERVAEEHDVTLANFFHAGDGNVHPNLAFDRRDADELRRVEEASAEIMSLCVEAGGTITGEHGVGLDKRDYMRLIFSDREIGAQRRLKRAFDPAGRCNPDAMLPPSSS
ncbi:MAG: FAD-binding oxidoreductase, partial [Gemmatimonadota bacterium]